MCSATHSSLSKSAKVRARLNAIFSSDIGHWDVPDITEVTEEAHELVDKGLIAEGDFRDFVFGNPVRLWAGMNPDFFKAGPCCHRGRARAGAQWRDRRKRWESPDQDESLRVDPSAEPRDDEGESGEDPCSSARAQNYMKPSPASRVRAW